MSAWRERALEWAFGPVDGIRLDVFRRAMAWSLLLYTLAWSRNAVEWLTPAGYHPSPEASLGLQMTVPLLGPVSVWVFLALYMASMAAVVFGVRPRLASVLVLVGVLYVSTADRLAAFSMNKLYIVVWAILVCTPWERSTEGARAPRLRSAWPLRILQGTLVIEYLGAGLCKAIYGDYLGHDDVLWYQLQLEFMTDTSAWMIRSLPDGFFPVSQWAALLFELLAPVLFIVRRLRPLAFAWGLAMHLLIGVTMYQVGYFALQIVGFYVLFVDDALLHRLAARLRPAGSRSAESQ
jgi:hypothetical protein